MPLAASAPGDGGEGTPDSTWLNADIAGYARENGIDLQGATRKADMLARISEA